METHAHDLHKAPGHGWKHYLFEFFMLFLAVFCGFLAENWREHIADHEREKQYIESLLSDLSADTARFNSGIPNKEQRINAIDTVFTFFNTHQNVRTISGKLFKTLRRTQFDQIFTRNNITINQLKNAGGMRLIRNKQVADSIAAYDFRCESYVIYVNYYSTNQQIANRYIEKMTSSADLLPFFISNSGFAIVANIPDSISIHINTDGLNEQLNFMMLEKAYARQEIIRYKELEARAVRLIELIRKEYHIE